jgi:hypothetical protein
MVNRIVFSTDKHPTYAWFLPLSSLAWQHVAGFKPLILTVGEVPGWIVERTVETGADVVSLRNVPGVGSGAMAQFCRLFAYNAPPVADDDYLMVVDSDAWPCQHDVFQPSGLDMDAIYPAGMPYSDPPMFPVGYVGMQASAWRSVIGYEAASIEESVARVLREHPMAHARAGLGDPMHNFDELFLAERIMSAPGLFPERTRKVPREGGIPAGRIDRARWPSSPDPLGMIDAHLLRPGWTDENWPRLWPLFSKLVPHMAAWAQSYRDEWVRRAA